MRRALLGLCSAAAALLFSAACSEPAPRPPHLVLLLVDTLRADHLGAYGYERPTSPRLDRLAREGILFTRAFAPSSWTKPSVASLFTSRLPSEHGVTGFATSLGPGAPTLAERLRAAGYRTVGVSGNPAQVSARQGFGRGFDVFEPILIPAPGPTPHETFELEVSGKRARVRLPTAAEMNRAILALPLAADEAPLFLYVHYVDPHTAYAPPEEQRRRFVTDPRVHARGVPAKQGYMVSLARGLRSADAAERQRLVDLYDAEIATVDEAIGALLDALGERGLLSRSVVVVTSDHGEEFGDHGGWMHGLTLYQESIAVPLLVRDFRRAPRGQRRDEPVDLLDVPTTLLALAGVEPAPGMRGRNLLGEEGVPPRELVSELHKFAAASRPDSARRAVVRWPWKAIARWDGTTTFYRLDEDPAERRALPADHPGPPRELASSLSRLDARMPMEKVPSTLELDESSRNALRALGYVD